LLGFFPSIGAACDAVSRIIAEGIVPAGLEIMDQASLHARFRRLPGLRIEAAAALLCELDGEAEEIDDATTRIRRHLPITGGDGSAPGG
jgi:glycolate oxidase